jgi:DME family drug/metabolite transporter
MRARLTILFSAICFGTTGTAAALGPANANSLAVGTSRIVIGALLLQLFALGKSAGRSPIRLRAWLWAGAGMASYQLTFFAAVHSGRLCSSKDA